MVYGATKLVRSVKSGKKKVLQKYILDDILHSNKISLPDLQKISVILGCDHAEKSAGIGPKTVIKKYTTVVLNDSQIEALKVFNTNCNVASIEFKNTEYTTLKIPELLDWLGSKNFSIDRIKKQISKVIKI